jgi:hypothetical protein
MRIKFAGRMMNFAKGVHQEEEALLREILRTIDKKLITMPTKAKERLGRVNERNPLLID